jgi:hypothetical protein
MSDRVVTQVVVLHLHQFCFDILPRDASQSFTSNIKTLYFAMSFCSRNNGNIYAKADRGSASPVSPLQIPNLGVDLARTEDKIVLLVPTSGLHARRTSPSPPSIPTHWFPT